MPHQQRLNGTQTPLIVQDVSTACMRVCDYVCERQHERVNMTSDVLVHLIKTLNYFKYLSVAHLPP